MQDKEQYLNADEVFLKSEKKRNSNKFLLILVIILFLLCSYFGLVAFKKINFDFSENTEGLRINELEKELAHYKNKYSLLEQTIDYVKEAYYKDVSDIDFDEATIKGVFSSLNDPYSTFFNEKEFESFMQMNQGSYAGLGITIGAGKDGLITVIGTFDDTPASKAGIKAGDKIIKVEGEEYPADKMDIAVSKMKGEEGTDVSITILRDEEEIEMTLTRAIIIIESVESEILESNPEIGYIRIKSFDDRVSQNFIENYEAMKDKNISSFIIDLRGNPGGSLEECVYLADYLLGEQVIVSTKDRKGFETVFDSDKRKVDLPFVVLIDGGSASASEILASAIQDGKSAKLIGTKTFGKGIVQTVIPVTGNQGIKLTTSEYFTTNGRNIHKIGIEPDIKLELSKDYQADNKLSDNQLQKAIEILKEEMK